MEYHITADEKRKVSVACKEALELAGFSDKRMKRKLTFVTLQTNPPTERTVTHEAVMDLSDEVEFMVENCLESLALDVGLLPLYPWEKGWIPDVANTGSVSPYSMDEDVVLSCKLARDSVWEDFKKKKIQNGEDILTFVAEEKQKYLGLYSNFHVNYLTLEYTLGKVHVLKIRSEPCFFMFTGLALYYDYYYLYVRLVCNSSKHGSCSCPYHPSPYLKEKLTTCKL